MEKVLKKKNKAGKYSMLRNQNNDMADIKDLKVENVWKVHQVRELTESTYVLRFDRNGMDFEAGQHITLGIAGSNQVREYSIYSSTEAPYLEVLIKKVEDGLVSKQLYELEEGDLLNVDGPFGFFTIDETQVETGKFLFIATGTGIAPFHSMVTSHKDLDYKLLHGVRNSNECYGKEDFEDGKQLLCVSGGDKAPFEGRVTEYLKMNDIELDTLVYLCGNCDMIYEAYDILTAKGLPADKIKTEVYF